MIKSFTNILDRVVKNYVKPVALAGGVALLLSCGSSANAALASATINGLAGSSMVPTNQVALNQVTIANPSSTNMTIVLYDSYSTTLTQAIGAYTNFFTYLTNASVVFTDYSGVITTNTYTNVAWTVSNAVAAHTNNMSVIATLSIGTNATIVYQPFGGYNTRFGIFVTNTTASGPATVTINYSDIK